MTGQKTCLICIDGWGISENPDPTGDAIRNAKTPVMDDLEKRYPFTPIAAHGLAVGLPDGLMGNSEVGHLNIGAGRIVYQDIVRIDLSIRDDKLKNLPNLVAAFDRAKAGNGRLHYLGLVSDGGVHSHNQHLYALLAAAKEHDVPTTYIHFFGDGRDTAPRSASKYLTELLEKLGELEYGKVADIIGRYYSMDRDKRWERVQVAYEMLVQGKGEVVSDPVKAIEERYAKDETDEFLKPIIVEEEGRIKDGDTLIFFNYRSDRMREINQALGITPLPFETDVVPKDISITTFTQYKADYPFPNIFPPQKMDNVLSEVIGKIHNLPQVHIAETEKYAHVTFFFNGGSEAQFPLEQRDLIASPKVATYDLQPAMSAIEVGQKVAERVLENSFSFVMCNFAPPDMVGHTGMYERAIQAVEATDKAIGIVYEACKKAGYVLFVTADHGNAEKMVSENGGPHTAHTTSKVPFIMTSTVHKFDAEKSKSAGLCDVAPTILEVMGLAIPEEMTGKSILAA
ncbi:2,3-bisphosphoglycerate-independent phosphoglycerate mutase [Cladochytrium replicatum]|nr:2,3-bisphosphoglycerate-independent phosphoglycerate mutase [Cladochytrium replicatum]